MDEQRPSPEGSASALPQSSEVGVKTRWRLDTVSAAVAIVLVVFDVVCVGALKSTAPHEGAPVLVVWLVGQALICVAGGAVEVVVQTAGRNRFILAASASVLFALAALLAGDSSSASTSCSSAQPCDTSFGLGALLIGAVSFPIFFGAVALGRSAARWSRGPNHADADELDRSK